MKIKLLIILTLISLNHLKAQEYTKEADSLTSEIIFQKAYKFEFLQHVYLLSKISPERKYFNPEEKEFGDEFILKTTFAMGEWAVKPDFKVYLSDYKSLWIDYAIYSLFYPITPLNDRLTALYAFRKFWLGSQPVTEYSPPFSGSTYVYNSINGDLKEAYLPFYFGKKSDRDLF